MNVLAIDPGGHSIKFLEIVQEKNNSILNNLSSIPIHRIKKDHPDASLEVCQLTGIKNHLEKRNFKGKIICGLPSSYITTRYLDIPVLQKKKVEQIIPFQLDESIPFSLSQTHYTSILKKREHSTLALIMAVKLDDFNRFHNLMNDYNIIPDILTNELSALFGHHSQNNLETPCCVLNIGHDKTTATFIDNDEIISNHISHMGGKNIDEAIAYTYQITEEEAEIYKHANCFLLTKNQLEQVNKEQREFAHLIGQSFHPLIQDYQRWHMGIRIKHRMEIENIYITGGGSNIKNIAPFLMENLTAKVSQLDIFSNITLSSNTKPPSSFEYASFATAATMTMTGTKVSQGNFLIKEYSNNLSGKLPLHTLFFVGFRLFLILLVLSMGLGIEKRILTTKRKKIDRKITKILKSTQLNIPHKTKKSYRKNPKKVLKFLREKNKKNKNDIDKLISISNINAVKPLIMMSKKLSLDNNVKLIKFTSNKDSVLATFHSTRKEKLDELKKNLQAISFSGMKISISNDELILGFKGI